MDIGPGVHKQINAEAGGDPPDLLDLRAQQVGTAGTVLEVDTHGARANDRSNIFPDGGGIVRIAALKIDAQRHADHAGDFRDRGDQHGDGQEIPVRITMRPGDGCTGGGDGLRADALDQAGAASVPGVGQEQQAGLMQRMEETDLIRRCRGHNDA